MCTSACLQTQELRNGEPEEVLENGDREEFLSC